MTTDNKTNDGGPAFPQMDADPGSIASHPGMTLRDWFAGQAMQGMLANPELVMKFERVAECAYDIADAMLEAREGDYGA